uniref:Uncharacterized protein n=1 Tax=Cucumis sativus TaxID=3659 RepID=A0A0A0LSB3_CUCSA
MHKIQRKRGSRTLDLDRNRHSPQSTRNALNIPSVQLIERRRNKLEMKESKKSIEFDHRLKLKAKGNEIGGKKNKYGGNGRS